jgi:hypothetical protein
LFLLHVSDSMYPSSGIMYRSLLILWLQLGILRLCVVRTWQLSHRVYIPVLVPVGGVVLFCRVCVWLLSVNFLLNIQCTSRNNKVKMKVMHGINMDKPSCTVQLLFRRVLAHVVAILRQSPLNSWIFRHTRWLLTRHLSKCMLQKCGRRTDAQFPRLHEGVSDD